MHAAQGFRYLVATDARHDAIVRVLSESFCREPMAEALGMSASTLLPMIERLMPECIGNGLSAIAVPENEPQTVAGVCLSRDFKSPLPEGIPGEFPWLLPIGHALMTVTQAYAAKRRHLKAGDAVELWMVAVAERRFARRGVASRLFRVCASLAREHGFKRCVTECSGRYSQIAAERAGFKEAARLAYRQFRFDGRAVYAAIDAPHTHLALYERDLSEESPGS